MTKPTPRGKQLSDSGKGVSVISSNLRNPRSGFFVCSLLFALTVWVFVPVLQDGFHIFDDQSYILGNAHVNDGLSWSNILWAFYGFGAANWHPLTWLSHMVDVQVYGLNPWGHHLTNVLIHAINTVLVFLVFRRMTGAAWRSLVVALLFGLHPLRVEPVAWISERKDVLSTMFWLLAMWAYARFAEETRIEKGRTKSFYGLTLFFFGLGLMSKQMVVTLPFVFLLLDFWPLNRWQQNNRWRLVLEKIPFFALMVAGGIMAYIAKQSAGALQEIHLSLGDRVGNAFISYVRYLGKLFWPTNLCLYYPHPGHWPTMFVLPAALFVFVVSVMAWVKRRQIPYLFTGWFWYVGTLVPVIGLVQLHSLAISDVWTYVPLMGISLILVWGLCEVTKQWRQQTLILSTLLTVALIPCIIISRHQIAFWKDDITVWSRAVNVTKDNYVAHDNLGAVLDSTQHDAAFVQFQEAVRINPNYADAQRWLANELSLQGHFDEAIVHYQKALEIDPNAVLINGNIAKDHYSLGNRLLQKGQMDEAIIHYQKALAINPDYAEAHCNLGLALMNTSRTDDAIIQYQKALAINPNYAAADYNLGVALFQKGLVKEAIASTQRSLHLAIAQNNVTLVMAIQKQLKIYQAGSP